MKPYRASNIANKALDAAIERNNNIDKTVAQLRLNENALLFKKKIDEAEGLAARFLRFLNVRLDKFSALENLGESISMRESELLNLYSLNYQYYSKTACKLMQEYNEYMRENLKKD